MEETKLLLDRGGKIYEGGKVRKTSCFLLPQAFTRPPPALKLTSLRFYSGQMLT